MKIANFIYTDAKGKITNRKLAVFNTPTDKYSGIDVSELSDEEIGMFAGELNTIYDAYTASLETLKEKFDVKYGYRQFLEKNIQDLKIELL